MPFCIIIMIQGRVVQSWVNITRVSARFEFWYESLKSKLIIHLNTFCQQVVRENGFEQKKKKPGLSLTLGYELIGLQTTGPG